MTEYQPAEYQKLEVRQYPTRTLRETAEGKFWRRFKAPTVSKQVRDAAGLARIPHEALLLGLLHAASCRTLTDARCCFRSLDLCPTLTSAKFTLTILQQHQQHGCVGLCGDACVH